MPVSSLPSPYGIGTLGKSAYEFIDFLADAGQKYWQVLPLGPTSYGDSPYRSFSTFAGNPYFVDFDMLIKDGLLTLADLKGIDWGDDETKVDYGKVYSNRFTVLRKAYENGIKSDRKEFDAFCEENKRWLAEYSMYMAVKNANGGKSWLDWEDDEIRLHKPEAIKEYSVKLHDDIEFYQYIQFLFFQQWAKLKAYAGEKGIGIIGDLPIYVAMDSADVWAEPQWFQLDEKGRPTDVSGVPPDAFTRDGQLWGNPLYDWDAMEKDGFGWWIRRIGGAEKLFDVIRIDHFRGFEAYWAVPAEETTAKNGRWVQGPGMKCIGALSGWFKDVAFIAEDLGFLTPGVKQLLEDSKFPGMKVLEFAFDTREPSNYLPHTYNFNCVCYVGTHDNETIMQWKDKADPADLAMAKKYLNLTDVEGLNWGMIRGGMSSTANLFVAQIQDYLGLGAEGRINTPGTASGNWAWRIKPDAITKELTEKIADMTKLYGRSNL